ncbi:MAG TPA: HEAT repeat domain-containing protein, partial [Verrucomicrobiae bacterium]|nr:HEAT repeat domain-containing protein [Verrucomicrobiae bacterium]
ALGRLRAVAAMEPIREMLKDPIWEVRKEAAESLARLNDRQAVPALGEALADSDADVREAAAIALGSLGDRRAIGPLVLALRDPTSGVRRITAAALSRIDTNWSSSPEARAAIEQLRAALQDNDPGVRHFVGQLLVNLGALDPEAAPGGTAEDFLASSPAKRRKLAVSLLVTVLCDSDRDLRQAAAEALGRLGDPRAESALRRLQGDPDAGVRTSAEIAILALGNADQPLTN